MSGRMKRRDMIKSLAVISGTLALTPFVPVKDFLIQSFSLEVRRQKIANIRDLEANSRILFTYSKTGNPERDSDPFRKFLLIRLPDGSLRAYSAVCVHLWCLVDYKPNMGIIFCPCHGSVYDPENGVAKTGPAALQPNKTLPWVKIELDEDGNIYATGIIGVIGYGKEAAGDESVTYKWPRVK